MTSEELSKSFLYGLVILSKHRTEKFSINVIEVTGITVEGLGIVSDQEKEDLELFGWYVYATEDKSGTIAVYYKLDYVDS